MTLKLRVNFFLALDSKKSGRFPPTAPYNLWDCADRVFRLMQSLKEAEDMKGGVQPTKLTKAALAAHNMMTLPEQNT